MAISHAVSNLQPQRLLEKRTPARLSPIALLAFLTTLTANEDTTPAPSPRFDPATAFQQAHAARGSVTFRFGFGTGAPDSTNAPPPCAAEGDPPQLHPSKIPSEIHATWPTRPGVLYTVELSTDHQTWQLGPHLIGDGEIATYHLLEHFPTVGRSGLVRIRAYADPYTDPDGDGLDTIDEVTGHGTNPYNPDSDSDGVYDAHESASGTDPLDPASTTATPAGNNTSLVVHRPL